MQRPIERLEGSTSKQIHASLVFPSLTSIVLELVYNALTARPTSRVQVLVLLAPEWQVTCQDDGAGFPAPLERLEDSSLEYLSYLGTLDVQCGRRRLIQRVSLCASKAWDTI